MAKVSVVIATCNRARYLADAVASVLAQAFADFELVVVDDGSTDATREVVQRFSDPRVHYLHQAHRGVSAARNAGIHAIRGEYVAFLDDDDVFLPDKLRVQMRALEREALLGLVAGGHQVIDKRGQLLAVDQPWKWVPRLSGETLLLGNRFASNSVLVRRSWWERVGGFDETLTLAEDWDVWLRLALEGCRMAWTRRIVCGVRRHNGHASSDAHAMRNAELRVLQKMGGRAELPAEAERWCSAAIAHVYLRNALRHLALGQLGYARVELERAVAVDAEVLDRAARDLMEAIATCASRPSVDSPQEVVEAAFRSLPESAARVQRYRAEILAKVAVDRMFRSYRRRDWRLACGFAAEAVRLAPAYLGNRGVTKVAILSTLHSLAH
jgi:glycosyltransferase involved in cell wall biosynthesis